MNTACLICNDADSSAACICSNTSGTPQGVSDNVRRSGPLTPVLLVGTPPCIAEGTVLQSSHSYDNLVRPVALRLPLAATNVCNTEKSKGEDLSPVYQTLVCSDVAMEASHEPLILSTSNSAFTPIKSGIDAENYCKFGPSDNRTQSDDGLDTATDNTTDMEWTINQGSDGAKLHEYSFMHSDQLSFCHDKEVNFSDSPLTNRCHSQPCLCRTHECSSTLCLHVPAVGSVDKSFAKGNQSNSCFPVNNYSCTLSFTQLTDIQNQLYQQSTPTLSRARKSKFRLCRHMECGRRRRQSHFTSPGDFFVLSSGRSFLVGLPHFYRSSAGRRSKVLADLVKSLTTSTNTKPYNIINGCLLPTRMRAQSCTPMMCSFSSGNIQSFSALDYPELDLNQIEND